MIMAARNVVTGTLPAASTCSTSRRDCRWALSCSSDPPRPPRKTMRCTRAVAAAAAKRCRHLAVAPGVVLARRLHRMHEIEGGGTAFEVIAQRAVVVEIGLDHLDAGIRIPRPIVELARRARQAAHAVAGLEEARHQAGADVAGGAGHGDARARGDRRLSGGGHLLSSCGRARVLPCRSWRKHAGPAPDFAQPGLVKVRWSVSLR